MSQVECQPRPQRTLYFWHIPKTAGTSVTNWLQRHYEPEQVFSPYLLDGFVDECWQQHLGRSELLRGHFADAPLRRWPTPLTTITVLREPLARTLSHLAHIERDATNPVHDRLAACRGEVMRVLADPVLRPLVENTQTRWLGLPWRSDMTSLVDLDTVQPELIESLRFQFAPDPVDRRVAARALRRLWRMNHVGTTEKLRSFCARVSSSLGWHHLAPPRENARPSQQSAFRAESLSAADWRALRWVTRYDAALYGVARTRAAGQ